MLNSPRRVYQTLGITVAVIFLVSLCLPFMCFAEVNDPTVTLKAGTVVPLRLTETVSTETHNVGDRVTFEVTRDVKVNGYTVIAAGTIAIGEVVVSEPPGMFGREGKIGLTIHRTEAVDGTSVPLRVTLTRKGAGKQLLSVGGGLVLCPLLFLVKGEKGTIPAGSETKAYVDYDTEITVTG